MTTAQNTTTAPPGGPCGAYVPKVTTNADRIRGMGDEELANLLTDYSNNGGWVAEIGREVCYKTIAGWLQQPAEEIDDG